MSDDLLHEFIEESNEHLARLEIDLVALESNAGDPELLASAYRALHTLKGNCGFLALPRLEKLAHAAESLLARFRDGVLELTMPRGSLLLGALDVIRGQLDAIGRTGTEAPGEDGELIAALESGEPLAPAVAAQSDPRPDARTVRIDVELLDEMVGLVGELVLLRNRALRDDAPHAPRAELDRLTSGLQSAVMRARMEPVGRLFDRMPRLVRDLAAELGKEVRLRTSGSETELDRAILESFADPLTHLLRNAIDHGIERRGTVSLTAARQGGEVILEVRDDGRGIDLETLRAKAEAAGLPARRNAAEYVFEPGLSTAREVTRISGRGVGMDVVRTNVERLGGRIELRTKRGKGTAVRIRLPLTLAIIPGIVVLCRGQRFILPRRHVRELLRVRDRGAPLYPVGDAMLPVIRLAEVLGLPAGDPGGALAVVELEGRCFGLLVDRILDTQEVVVKPLGTPLRRIPVYGGATILGDGSIALILEIGGLVASAGVEPTAEPLRERAPPPDAGATKLLLAEDLGGRRVLLPLDAVERIEEVWADTLEQRDGAWCVPFGDEALPLHFLGEVEGAGETERVFLAIVRAHGQRRAVALARVRDVVRTSATGRTLVIRGEAADLVDLEAVAS